VSLEDLNRPKDPLVGRKIGYVEIQRWMADGQTGTIYFGNHSVSRKEVAVRVILPELAKRPGWTEKFLYAARLAQQINHPNIVRVVDAGEAGGHVYVAMEFVKGEPLEALVRRERKVDLERATRLVRDIARGLEAAHDIDLPHLDLRPANILLTTEGHPKISNFGLARPASTASGRTAVGDFTGPPDYLSPEQVEGRPVDSAADQYALGVIYFLLLTGELPFEGVNDADVARARLKESVPVIESLPLGAQQLMARLTARSPKDRFAGAREIAAACERVVYTRDEKPAAAEPEAPRRDKRPTWSKGKNVVRAGPPTPPPRPAQGPRGERPGLTRLPTVSWGPAPKLAGPYVAYLLAAACVAAGSAVRGVPDPVRAGLLAGALLPFLVGAFLLLRQPTRGRGPAAILLGAGALGILFYGLSKAEAVPTKLNAMALGAALLVAVAVSVLADFRKGLARRVMLVCAFALVAAGAAKGSPLDWMKASPAPALATFAVATFGAFAAVFLLPSPSAGRGVRFGGFVAALVAASAIAYAAGGGDAAALTADLAGRAAREGTVAASGVVVAAGAHTLLKTLF